MAFIASGVAAYLPVRPMLMLFYVPQDAAAARDLRDAHAARSGLLALSARRWHGA